VRFVPSRSFLLYAHFMYLRISTGERYPDCTGHDIDYMSQASILSSHTLQALSSSMPYMYHLIYIIALAMFRQPIRDEDCPEALNGVCLAAVYQDAGALEHPIALADMFQCLRHDGWKQYKSRPKLLLIQYTHITRVMRKREPHKANSWINDVNHTSTETPMP